MTIKLIIVGSIVMLFSACTAKQAYNTIQSNNRQECNKIAHDSERTECLRQSPLPYDDYKRERDKLLNQE